MPKPAAQLAHSGPGRVAVVSPGDATARRDLICKVAYMRAAGRNFQPGYELEDWLGAEREVDEALTRGGSPTAS
jgi:hypothetical protein